MRLKKHTRIGHGQMRDTVNLLKNIKVAKAADYPKNDRFSDATTASVLLPRPLKGFVSSERQQDTIEEASDDQLKNNGQKNQSDAAESSQPKEEAVTKTEEKPKVKSSGFKYNLKLSSSTPGGHLINSIEDLLPMPAPTPKTHERKAPGEIKKLFEASKDDNDNYVAPQSVNLDDPLITVGLPSDVLIRAKDITPTKVPDTIFLGNANIYVWVSEIYSPTKFWFHIDNADCPNELEDFMYELNGFFSESDVDQKYRMHTSDIIVGRACAAIYDRRWHRGEIVGAFNPDTKTVKVFFMDYGTTSIVPLDQLRHLSNVFASFPRQAHRGRMALVSPIGTDQRWSFGELEDPATAFLNFANDLLLYAKVYAYEAHDQIFHMLLYDVDTNSEPVCINKVMADYSFCNFHSPQFDDFPIPEDLYPTFEMLEQGISPSYVELSATKGKVSEPNDMDVAAEKEKHGRIFLGLSTDKPHRRGCKPGNVAKKENTKDSKLQRQPPSYVSDLKLICQSAISFDYFFLTGRSTTTRCNCT